MGGTEGRKSGGGTGGIVLEFKWKARRHGKAKGHLILNANSNIYSECVLFWTVTKPPG